MPLVRLDRLGLEQVRLGMEQPLRENVDHLGDDVEWGQAATPRFERRRVGLRVQLAQQHRARDGLAVGDLQLRAAVCVHVVLVDVGKDDRDVDECERQLAQRDDVRRCAHAVMQHAVG